MSESFDPVGGLEVGMPVEVSADDADWRVGGFVARLAPGRVCVEVEDGHGAALGDTAVVRRPEADEEVFRGVVVSLPSRRRRTLEIGVLSGESQKRAHVRVRSTVKVRYQILGTTMPDELPPQSDMVEGAAVDISGGGLLMSMKESTVPGTIIEVELDLDEPEERQIRALAVAARCEEADEEHLVGLRFEVIDEDDRDAVIAHVFSAMRHQLATYRRRKL